MIQQSCPITFIKVDGNIARINAFYIGLTLCLYLITLYPAIIYFLIIDFSTRLFFDKNYSLSFTLSLMSKNILNISTNMVDAGAKRLATYFGLIFVTSLGITGLLNLTIATYIIGSILLFCIFLEVAFNYCLGCKIYHLYKKLDIFKV